MVWSESGREAGQEQARDPKSKGGGALVGRFLEGLVRLFRRVLAPEAETRLTAQEAAAKAEAGKTRAASGGEEAGLVFMSGSKFVQAPSGEVDRFREICRHIGAALAGEGYAIVGCPSHPSRVLAAQEARKALQEITADAPFETGGVQFPLDAQERSRFVGLARAGVFVGGSSGTRQEFGLCKEYGVKPLIPVAGAGGAGHSLAQELAADQAAFWDVKIEEQVVACLASPDQPPEAYADAVLHVLGAYGRGGR